MLQWISDQAQSKVIEYEVRDIEFDNWTFDILEAYEINLFLKSWNNSNIFLLQFVRWKQYTVIIRNETERKTVLQLVYRSCKEPPTQMF